MAYREMTSAEIAERIKQGDLTVYVEEEYGFRYWFWFPDMSEDELMAYWEKCNIEEHFFNPCGLPGDMVPVPPDEECKEAYIDSDYSLMNNQFEKGSESERAEIIASYDKWQKKWFPNEAMWYEGSRSASKWRAHTHMEDDSWLKKPGD